LAAAQLVFYRDINVQVTTCRGRGHIVTAVLHICCFVLVFLCPTSLSQINDRRNVHSSVVLTSLETRRTFEHVTLSLTELFIYLFVLNLVQYYAGGMLNSVV